MPTFPEWLQPMAATLTQARFSGPERIFERHWVRPQIVVQVAFIEWTVHGKLRHPRLLGVRTDKPAREAVKET
jgi:bifunctional non-homologous end joining protein LigD